MAPRSVRVLRAVAAGLVLSSVILLGAGLLLIQTDWFKNRLRDYVVSRAGEYLTADLSIGHLTGSLLRGVELRNVRLREGQETVISVDRLTLDYSLWDMMSRGLVLDRLTLEHPVVALRQTAEGWNVSRLVRRSAQEEDRRGPGRPLTIGIIRITDGQLAIECRDGCSGDGTAVRIPSRLEQVDANLNLSYQPVDIALGIESLTLEAHDPEMSVREASGRVKVADDRIELDHVVLRTQDSSLQTDGTVTGYASSPDFALTVSAERLASADLARLVPALEQIDVTPRMSARLHGTLNDLRLEFDARDAAGTARGTVRLQSRAPRNNVTGDVAVTDLNLAKILRRKNLESRLSGRAEADISVLEWSDIQSIQGTFTLRAGPSVLQQYRVAALDVRGTIDSGRAAIRGSTSAYGAHATAEGTVVVPRESADPLALNLRGDVRNVNLRQLPARLGAPRVDSWMSGRYDVALSNRRMTGKATLDESRLADVRIARGAVATFAAGGSGAPEYGFEGTVAGANPHRLGAVLNIAALDDPRLDGTLNGHVKLAGSGAGIETTRLRAEVQLENSDIAGASVPALTAITLLDGRRLKMEIAGAFEHLDPLRLGAPDRLAGTLGGTMAGVLSFSSIGQGMTLEAIGFDGGLSVERSKIGQLEITRAAVGGRLAGSRLTLTAFDLVGPALRAHASGAVALTTDGTSALDYRLEVRRVADLASTFGVEANGTALLEGRLAGNRAQYSTSGTLTGNTLRYGTSIDLLQVKGRYSAELPRLEPREARGELQIISTLPTILRRPLRTLEADLAYDRSELTFKLNAREPQRSLKAGGRLLLQPEAREVHVEQLALETDNAKWQLEPEGKAVIRYGRDTVDLAGVRLVSGAQSIAANGTVALNEQRRSSLDVSFDRIDLASVGQMLLAPDLALTGTLDGTARLNGNGLQRRGQARFVVSKGSVRSFAFEGAGGELDFDPVATRLDVNIRQTQASSLTISGSAPSSVLGLPAPPGPAPPLDLRLKAESLSFAAFEVLSDQVTGLNGTIEADLRLTGTREQPRLEGQMAVANSAFQLTQTGAQYQGLNSTLAFRGDRIEIQKFHVADDDGDPLDVTGQIAVSGLSPGAFEATFRAQNFEILDNELGDIDADAELTMRGELMTPTITGAVRVHSGRVQVDRILERLKRPAPVDVGMDVEDGKEPAAVTGTTAPGVALNISVVVPNNLVVRGTDIRPANSSLSVGDMNVTLGGEFELRKAVDDGPVVVGTVRTVRGTYDFQDRRFDILSDGSIVFHGERPVNPSIDVTGEREISGIIVQVRVGGTADHPSIELRSEPPLDDSEILALIVFNQPLNQLSEGQRVNLADRAGAVATGFVVAPIVQSLGRALDADIFEVRGFGADGGGPVVRIGEQVGERLFMSLEQGFGAQEVTEVMLEYQLSELFRLKGSMAEGPGRANRTMTRRVERGGLDLVFLIRY